MRSVDNVQIVITPHPIPPSLPLTHAVIQLEMSSWELCTWLQKTDDEALTSQGDESHSASLMNPPPQHTHILTHQSPSSLCSKPPGWSSQSRPRSLQPLCPVAADDIFSALTCWSRPVAYLLCVCVCVCNRLNTQRQVVPQRPICFPSTGPINEQHLKWVHELPGNSASVSTRPSERGLGYRTAFTVARFK